MFTSQSYRRPPSMGPHVVIIGNFDGLHRGHQALLARARTVSEPLGLPRCVLTFEPHPSRFFGRSEPKAIYSAEDKRALLTDLGVESALFQRFDEPFASLSPKAFVEEVLAEGLQARSVIVGYDFAFGARRAGRSADLKALCAPLGIQVEVIEQQRVEGGAQAYSSTLVRALISAGELERAEEALTRPYHLRGTVARGYQRGRGLGFPTANLALESELCPPPGVYSGWLDWGMGPWPSVFSVGENPTFHEPHLLAHQQAWSVEVHVIDPEGGDSLNLYGREVTLWCHRRLREMRRFEDLEGLKAQIAIDRSLAAASLKALSPPTWPRRLG